jgi:hypothetical protein
VKGKPIDPRHNAELDVKSTFFKIERLSRCIIEIPHEIWSLIDACIMKKYLSSLPGPLWEGT